MIGGPSLRGRIRCWMGRRAYEPSRPEWGNAPSPSAYPPIVWDDVDFDFRPHDPALASGQSKTVVTCSPSVRPIVGRTSTSGLCGESGECSQSRGDRSHTATPRPQIACALTRRRCLAPCVVRCALRGSGHPRSHAPRRPRVREPGIARSRGTRHKWLWPQPPAFALARHEQNRRSRRVRYPLRDRRTGRAMTHSHQRIEVGRIRERRIQLWRFRSRVHLWANDR